jgi:3-hydroxyacyl-[acyl-carrier-protein] dehydratase
VGNLKTGEEKITAEISPADVLAMLPRGLRFRFLDEILEIDGTHVVARYRFREEEFFYPGHFPERAVTPGTILLEAMCQCGLAAQSYYLLAQETSIEKAGEYRILFTGAMVEWFEQTGPGSIITLRSELLAWRRHRIRARVKVFDEQNRLAAESELFGMGVLMQPEALAAGQAGRAEEEFAASRTIMGGTQHES